MTAIAPLIDDLRFGLWGKLITNPPDSSPRLASSTSEKRGLQRAGPPGYIGAGLSHGGVDSNRFMAPGCIAGTLRMKQKRTG